MLLKSMELKTGTVKIFSINKRTLIHNEHDFQAIGNLCEDIDEFRSTCRTTFNLFLEEYNTYLIRSSERQTIACLLRQRAGIGRWVKTASE